MPIGGRPGSPLVPPPTPGQDRGGGGPPGPRSIVGAASLQNVGKGDNENQDTYFAGLSSTGSKSFVAVFDGHGEKGKHMSNYARQVLAKSLFSHKDLHNDPGNALESAYRSTQHHIEREHGHDAAQSGTTAVSAYQHRDRLFVANVGDSRAVLGRCDTGRGKSVSAVELTRDQKPSRPDEKRRVLEAGGTVDQMAFPVLHNGGIRWMRGGPERVMDKNGMGGLAMSRSLGDLCLRPYVSSQPEVVERRLDSRDKLLVLGTDGVWDHVSSQEAVDIANQHVDPNLAAHEIAKIAKRRWDKETEGMMSDDITAVVVRLEAGSPSERGVGSAAPAASRVGSRGRSPASQSPASSQKSALQRRGSASGSAEFGRTMEQVGRRTAGSQFGRSRSQADMSPGMSTSPLKLGSERRLEPRMEHLPPAGRRSGFRR